MTYIIGCYITWITIGFAVIIEALYKDIKEGFPIKIKDLLLILLLIPVAMHVWFLIKDNFVIRMLDYNIVKSKNNK